MKLNKKGLGMLELIVSLGLVSLVLLIVLQMFADIRYEDTLTKQKGENLINQALMMKLIQDDLLSPSNPVKSITSCSGATVCYDIGFQVGTKRLTVTEKTITYAGEKKTLVGNAKFGYRANDVKYVKEPYLNGLMLHKLVIPASDSAGNKYDIEIVCFIY